MILISILIALIIERLAAKESAWQMSTYSNYYLSFSLSNSLFRKVQRHSVGFYLWLLIPALLLHFINQFFDFVLFELVINIGILLICFGCAFLREKYKGYLNALQRDDSEAATLYAMQLGQKVTEDNGGETIGQTLAWINFRFYGAVVFWFVLLGAEGALTYSLVRSFVDCVDNNSQSQLQQQAFKLQRLLFWLDWLPARIVSLGYLVIGNFTHGTSAWLKHAFNFSIPNRIVISEIAHSAEKVEEQFVGCTFEVKCMVKLVKRNMLFFLGVIAMLTLFGILG